MEKRLQVIGGDTVLEITEMQPVKIRLSKNELLRCKEYLENSIANFTGRLDDTNAQLAQIYEAETAQQ